MPKADKTMKELWVIKKKLSRELYGKSYEEMERLLAERRKEHDYRQESGDRRQDSGVRR
jgi:hypothetical protein